MGQTTVKTMVEMSLVGISSFKMEKLYELPRPTKGRIFEKAMQLYALLPELEPEPELEFVLHRLLDQETPDALKEQCEGSKKLKGRAYPEIERKVKGMIAAAVAELQKELAIELAK